MEFRPSINASLVLPFDDHVFFLDTQAGYEFHSRNKRLESERIAVDGSVRLRIGGCSIQPGLGYTRQLSDIKIGRAHAELQSLMRISYAVFCLKKKIYTKP